MKFVSHNRMTRILKSNSRMFVLLLAGLVLTKPAYGGFPLEKQNKFGKRAEVFRPSDFVGLKIWTPETVSQLANDKVQPAITALLELEAMYSDFDRDDFDLQEIRWIIRKAINDVGGPFAAPTPKPIPVVYPSQLDGGHRVILVLEGDRVKEVKASPGTAVIFDGGGTG